ncbi:uncharacterized protein [Apostichopus japonicus]|uniref:uncharacterized protein isoform X2 n=1 Tax=Stichopus japonicus TaxID=307972 RepID=UPI003AB1E0E4
MKTLVSSCCFKDNPRMMSRRRRTGKSEEERAVDACLKGEDTEGFRLGFIDEFIGSGVFCEKRFKKGDFLLEYRGELISQEEGEHREANYPEEVGSFLYFFCHNGKTKCIDATDSCGNGRMVNDGTNMANCKMRIVSLEGVPKLCLFALKDIEKGSELRCDYGVSDLPWRKREQIQMETNKVPQESSSEQSEKAKNLTHYPEENRDSSEVFQQLSEASTSKTINKEANIIAGESKQPPRYKKPSRKCPFCGKYYQEKLTRHIKLVHKDEEQVKRALELPQRKREKTFALMRKEGILQANQLQMKVDNPKYEVERRTATENPLVICGLCKGFYSTRFFFRHKAICQGDSCLQASPVPVSLMTPELRVNQNISEVERRTATKTPLGFITEEHENENSSRESDKAQRRSHAKKGKQKRMLKLPQHKRLMSLRCATRERVSGSCESDDRDSSEVFEKLSSSKTVNKEANGIAGNSKQPPRFKKPTRKCPFCGIYCKKKLTRHLKLVHKDEEQVKRALELPKQEMEETFALIRKEEILHANKLLMKVDNPKYEVEKRTATKTSLGFITEDHENEYSSCKSDKTQRRSHAKKGKRKTMLKLPQHKRLLSLRCTTRERVSGSCGSDGRDSSEVFQHLSEASSSKTVNKEANGIAGNSKQPPRYKKPSRKCPFCGKYYKEKLTRHIKLVHKDEEQVKRALELPKQEMEETFALMRKEGILHANQLQMKVDNPKYEVERRVATENPLVICGLCKGFYSTRFFTRHKAICQGDSCLQACSVPVSLVTPECRLNRNISEFQRDILHRFREDEVSEVCRSDPVIVDIGKRLWDASRNKEDIKKTEVRKCVMSDMRRLASLYRCFKEQHEIHGTGPLERGTARDMFQSGNFYCLTEAISSYSGEGNELKPGLKIGLFYLLKKSCKIVKATHLVEGQNASAEEIDQFVAILELNHNYLFGDAKHQIDQSRKANLRNPAALPLEEDVKKLQNYISTVITTMMENDVIVWDSYNFKKLRDVVVARLTLFNAKHCGEPCRLSIEEWKEAMADAWIDETQADAISDPIEEHMLTKLKVTYQTVRGNNRLVPVLFPDDCIQAIEVLTSSAARSSAGVLASNGYVFPRIQSSPNHVMGWHALSGICHDAEVSSKTRLTATRNRHHISTLYASMDVPASERASYLKHMGYSTDVSENIDEAPPAVKEVVEVGQPQQIDAAKKRKCSEEVKAGQEKKTRTYTKWTESDTKLVKEHFHSIITDHTAKTIPNKTEVEGFMKVTKLSRPYPWQTVRTKVMNEREKWKKRFTGRMQAMIEGQLL